MGWLTAFVNGVTIIIVKGGGFFGHPQFDMGNVGFFVAHSIIILGVSVLLSLLMPCRRRPYRPFGPLGEGILTADMPKHTIALDILRCPNGSREV